MVEYVDHLHEHFTDPVRTRDGRYVLPSEPGFSATMKAESIAEYTFPDGPAWR
jgi:L-fuconate dehydratase